MGETSDPSVAAGVFHPKGRRCLAPHQEAVGGMDAAQELIGRREELASLTWFLGSLGAGPRALLVEGEAGIGKTALWQAGLTRSQAVRQRTLACRPTGSGGQLSLPPPRD